MKNDLTNYAQWSKVFDEIEKWEIGHTDEQIIIAIKNGSIKWVSGTADRFTNRLLELLNFRFTKLNKFYNDRLKVCFDTFEFSKILISFRNELRFLKTLVNINALPKDIREKLNNDIVTFAQNAQKNLETRSKQDLSGELKRIIMGNKIDNI